MPIDNVMARAEWIDFVFLPQTTWFNGAAHNRKIQVPDVAQFRREIRKDYCLNSDKDVSKQTHIFTLRAFNSQNHQQPFLTCELLRGCQQPATGLQHK